MNCEYPESKSSSPRSAAAAFARLNYHFVGKYVNNNIQVRQQQQPKKLLVILSLRVEKKKKEKILKSAIGQNDSYRTA